MTTYRDAVRRLQIIYNECAPQDAANNRKQVQDFDDFTLAKKRLHRDAKEVRDMLRERDELLSYKAGTKEAAEASYRIRLRLKALRDDLAKLQSLQRQDEIKRKSSSLEDSQKYTGRAEIISLVQQHIDELEALEKKRFTDKINSERSALMSGAVSIKMDPSITAAVRNHSSDPYASDLPPIDDDPDVAEGLKMLQGQNQDIDRDLDEIHANVMALKEIAIDMDSELKKQNLMLDSIDKKVENTQAHLSNVNLKMKKAVDGVMKGDKFIVNSILLCVVLALAAFIGSQFLPKQ